VRASGDPRRAVVNELATIVPIPNPCRWKLRFRSEVARLATLAHLPGRLHGGVSPDRRQTLGHRGEEIAARHLERAGWRIVERNYRVREGEIDLIAVRGATLAFCEVKTLVHRSRRTRGPANPVESVGYRKQVRVRRMARTWLASHATGGGLGVSDLRLDVIGVVLSPAGELMRLEHLEGAF
jgi:putative endonuclease